MRNLKIISLWHRICREINEKNIKLLWKKQNLSMFFLNLCVYLCLKWCKIHIFVANYLLYVFTYAERENHFVTTSYLQWNQRKKCSGNSKTFWCFSWICVFICTRNSAKIHIFVANYILYVFTNAERENSFVMTSYLQWNQRKNIKLLWKQQNLLMFFLNLCVYLCTKWCQNIHIFS